MSTLAERVRARDRAAIARALTVVDRGGPVARSLLNELRPATGRAHVVGVTGAPGVGKSTLVDALALEARQRGRSVGILAVDPSSPFTGGAILGDRIRMQDAVMDPGVFMRSLASRGQTGGLSRAAEASLEVLDAAGFDLIFLETVGAGQSEIDVMGLAQSVAVVMAPGLGDDIQAIKAGILEIADLFVVNKADREGADRTVRELRNMLQLVAEPPPWTPRILKTVAQDRVGIGPVLDTLDEHRTFLQDSGEWETRYRRRAMHLVRQILLDEAERRLAAASGRPGWNRDLDRIASGQADPTEVALKILSGDDGMSEG
jgi:LAO/AO transport system kinase